MRNVLLMAVCLCGTACADVCSLTPGNLVANCGFETGSFADWTVSASFTGVATGAFDNFSAYSGSDFAYLGAYGSDGTLSQTLTTVAGAQYNLSWYLGSDGATPNDFSAYWDGNLVFSATNIPSTSDSYTSYTFSVLGTGSDTLTFDFRNDSGYLALDSISVAAPEPATAVLVLSPLAMIAWLARRRASSHC